MIDLRANAVVEPGDHVGIVLNPRRVAVPRRGGEVMEDAALLEGDLKEGSPL